MGVEVTTVEVTASEVVEVSQVQAPVVEVDIVPSAASYEVVAEQVVVVETAPSVSRLTPASRSGIAAVKVPTPSFNAKAPASSWPTPSR